jgi:hypothetical protein
LEARIRIRISIKVTSRIRIWISIKVTSRIRIWINIKVTSRIRIRIKVASRIRIRIRVMQICITGYSDVNIVYKRLKLEPWRALDAHSGGVEAQNGVLEAL